MKRLLLLTLLLTGCTAPLVKPEVDLPERPALPRVPAAQLQCLSDEAYAELTRRDLLLRQYAEQLEVVIQILTAE